MTDLPKPDVKIRCPPGIRDVHSLVDEGLSQAVAIIEQTGMLRNYLVVIRDGSMLLYDTNDVPDHQLPKVISRLSRFGTSGIAWVAETRWTRRSDIPACLDPERRNAILVLAEWGRDRAGIRRVFECGAAEIVVWDAPHRFEPMKSILEMLSD